ncbi:MAG: peptidoglycan-binding domain-containing protein [Micromonosporaceae bacterium]
MGTRTWRLGVAAVALAGIGVAAPLTVANAGEVTASWVYCDYPYQYLKYGCQGPDVATVQKRLNCVGIKTAVDGYFGSDTRYSVMTFQKRVGLTVDGVVGPNTWNALIKYC